MCSTTVCQFKIHAMEHVEESDAKLSFYSKSLVSSANPSDSSNVQGKIFKVNCRFLRLQDCGNIWHLVIVSKCAAFFTSLTFCTFWPDKDVRPQSNILNWTNNTIRFFSPFLERFVIKHNIKSSTSHAS